MNRSLVAVVASLIFIVAGAIAAVVLISPRLFPEPQPYEFKGNRLGMTLAEFKQKHHRVVPGAPTAAPCCSDSVPEPTRVELKSLDWHAKAGIVTCSPTFPFENQQGNGPTIAGFSVDKLIYWFVDERLYQITAEFPRDSFELITSDLTNTYGSPARVTTGDGGVYANWDNGVTAIEAREFATNTSSLIVFAHVELAKRAEARQPNEH